MLNFLGDIGGFLSILNLVGFMVAQYFSEFMMKAELYQRLYQVKKKPGRELVFNNISSDLINNDIYIQRKLSTRR